MFFCCVIRWIILVNVFDRPFGPQTSKVHRSISSVEVCWLVFRVLIVVARWGILKNASWLKNISCLLGFLGFRWWVIWVRSFDSKIPIAVEMSAISLIVFGMVTIVVVCRVDIFVMVPIRTDAIIRRASGCVMFFVSLWVVWWVRGYSVIVNSMICVL